MNAGNAARVRDLKGTGANPSESDHHLEGIARALERGDREGVIIHASRLDSSEAWAGIGAGNGLRHVAVTVLAACPPSASS